MDDTVFQAQRAADILDRLRWWSNPNRSAFQPCALGNAAQSVAQLLAAEAAAVGAAITLGLSDDAVCILGNPVGLEQVVFNLVRNTLDADDAARVVINIRRTSEKAILEVADAGPGVPDDL